MRVDFCKTAEQVLNANAKAIFLTGDLGYNALEKIAANLGIRFVNAGVAEQNMVGVAAGLALSGQEAWLYSIAPFVTYRCLEQIRNDVCLHNLPVRIIGNGGGFTYGIMGSTHHALEDIAVLKSLPNMKLYFPCTNDHVASAVHQMDKASGPAYLRLAISGFPFHTTQFEENPTTLTRQYAQGEKLTLIGVGHATQIVLNAMGLANLNAEVFGIAKYPFDWHSDQKVWESVKKTKNVLVVEEHYSAGSIAESLALEFAPLRPRFAAMNARYFSEQKYGSSTFHLKQCALTPEDIVIRCQKLMETEI
jgi:transketolase